MRLYLTLVSFSFGIFLSAQSWERRISPEVNIGDTTQTHQLILLDYSKLLGVVTYANGDSIRIQLRSVPETVSIPIGQLRFLGVFNGKASLKYGKQGGPSLRDLTYERTALPAEGRGRLKIINLLYLVREWNVGTHFDLGVGLAGPVGVLLTQRYRTSLKSWLHLGVSNQTLLAPLLISLDDRLPLVGDVTALATIGTEERFFNLGSGFFYSNEDNSVRSFRLGFGGRLNRRWHAYGEFVAAVSESTLTVLPTFNVAYGHRRHRFSFGTLSILEDEEFITPLIPYLSYSLYY